MQVQTCICNNMHADYHSHVDLYIPIVMSEHMPQNARNVLNMHMHKHVCQVFSPKESLLCSL